MVISQYFLSSFIPLSGSRNSHIFKEIWEKAISNLSKKSNKILFLEIIFVEVQQRDHICRGSDQLYNSCKESGDYNCKGSIEDFSVQKRMILVKGQTVTFQLHPRLCSPTVSARRTPVVKRPGFESHSKR